MIGLDDIKSVSDSALRGIDGMPTIKLVVVATVLALCEEGISKPASRAVGASVKTPALIMFHGGVLGRRVLIENRTGEIGALMAATLEPARASADELRERPWVAASLYHSWNPPEIIKLLALGSPERFSPTDADQQARFYPAFGDAKPLFVYFGPPLASRWPRRPGVPPDTVKARVIQERGLTILARHGLPVWIPRVLAEWAR